MAKIAPPRSSKEWDNFLIQCNGSFLQSFSWGDFKKNFQQVERLEARSNNQLIGVCQFFEEKNIFGRYCFIPHGPVSSVEKVREALLKEVLLKAKKKGLMFIHAEPQNDINLGLPSFFRVEPKRTIVNDIKKNDDQLLKSFSSNTRYNIRYAQKRGVNITESDDVASFLSLIKKTEKRQSFHSYQKTYFQKLLKNTPSTLYLATYKSKIIAGLTVLHFGETASCLHSGIDYSERKLKAPNLLRFEAMKRARDRGMKKFDFWGIDEKKFSGVTSFKRGFRGNEFVYPEERDIPLKKINYLAYKIGKKIKTRH